MRQTTDFHLIKTFAACNPSSHPHSKSRLLCRFKTVRQSSSKRWCVQGEPFPGQIVECTLWETAWALTCPTYPTLQLLTARAEGKTAGIQRSSITDLGCYSSLTWAPTSARGRTSHENSLPIAKISPGANLTFWSIDLGSHCSPCFPPP